MTSTRAYKGNRKAENLDGSVFGNNFQLNLLYSTIEEEKLMFTGEVFDKASVATDAELSLGSI